MAIVVTIQKMATLLHIIYILHNITMRKVFLDARKASDIYDDLFASQGKSF